MSAEKKMKYIVKDLEDFSPLIIYIKKLYFKEYEDVIDLLKKKIGSRIVCLDENCKEIFLTKDLSINYLDKMLRKNVEVIGLGIFIGSIIKKRFVPSPHLLEIIYRSINKIRGAVSAEKDGVKNFLYGKDLLYRSLKDLYPPLEKGDIIAVLDKDDYSVIGVGELLEDLEKIMILKRDKRYENMPIVANVMDLGIYLRAQHMFIE
ncbi:MAG: hypothetical protein JHC19_03800 [Desulfurococcaceae archaeon]|jgi:ribosome biogenesis protein Nip4|nr:hypothetical protein [Desulfurococcaceae archaeon]